MHSSVAASHNGLENSRGCPDFQWTVYWSVAVDLLRHIGVTSRGEVGIQGSLANRPEIAEGDRFRGAHAFQRQAKRGGLYQG